MAVPAVWMCVGGNFHDCRAAGPGPFDGRTPLAVDLGVGDEDRPFYDAAVAATTRAGPAAVTYGRTAAGFPRPAGPSPLWHLARAVPVTAE